MRGASHSGNVSARALAADGLLDILSSDYIPFSLIQSAFFLGEVVDGISLPQAVAMVSKNPAEAVGLDRPRRHRDRPPRRSGARARRRPCARRPHGMARGTPRRMMASALIEREQASAAADPQRRLRRGGRPERRRQGHADRAMRRDRLADEPQVEFVRRVITRPSDGETEDHDTLADAAFVEAQSDGAFALVLGGARLALRPAGQRRPDDRERAMSRSPTSRAARCRAAQGALRQCRPWSRSPPIGEILAARLGGRGRESRGEVLARLARSAELGGTAAGAIAHRQQRHRARKPASSFVAVMRKAIAVRRRLRGRSDVKLSTRLQASPDPRAHGCPRRSRRCL